MQWSFRGTNADTMVKTTRKTLFMVMDTFLVYATIFFCAVWAPEWRLPKDGSYLLTGHITGIALVYVANEIRQFIFFVAIAICDVAAVVYQGAVYYGFWEPASHLSPRTHHGGDVTETVKFVLVGCFALLSILRVISNLEFQWACDAYVEHRLQQILAHQTGADTGYKRGGVRKRTK